MMNNNEPIFKIDETGIVINKPITITTNATSYEEYVCGKNLLEPLNEPKLTYITTSRSGDSFF